MAEKDFRVGDLVWAKMKSYPPWPSRISDPSEVSKPSITKKGQHFVYFFGSKNYAWIPDDRIEPHSDKMYENLPKKSYFGFLKGIEEIKEANKKWTPRRPSNEYRRLSDSGSKAFDSLREKTGNVKKSSPEKKKAKKRPLEVNGEDSEAHITNKYTPYLGRSYPAPKKHASIQYFDSPSVTPSFNSFVNVPHCADSPATPPLNIKDKTATLIGKNIKPSSKKIGFLGLGALGSGIVKNLLNSGHDVTVWNINPDKCEPFEEAGARVCRTPCDVVEYCDVIFSCVLDPHASKVIFFERFGVLKGLEDSDATSKGYIELSGIDPKTSEEIGKEVCTKGAKYLEAPVSGSRSLAIEGQLLVLAAGDQELFYDCKSCFDAFSKDPHFISSDIGTACKMNLILSLFKGCAVAALAEAIALVKCCGLDTQDFLKFLSFTNVSQLLEKKGQAMVERKYARDITLKHQQKDLALALTLATGVQQPLGVGTASNEVYKRAKQRYCSDLDVSAVIEGARLDFFKSQK